MTDEDIAAHLNAMRYAKKEPSIWLILLPATAVFGLMLWALIGWRLEIDAVVRPLAAQVGITLPPME